MDELFLHFVWKWGRFNMTQLQTTEGEQIKILHRGMYHHHSGPDFMQARLEIGGTLWAGQVEIHVKSSEWYKHKHHMDAAYKNTILHVVFEEDQHVYIENGKRLPTLVLKDRIEKDLYQKVCEMRQIIGPLPCQQDWPQVTESARMSMAHRSLAERLLQKSQLWLNNLDQDLKGDWQSALYQAVAASLGGTANSEAMLRLSGLIPLSWIYRIREDAILVEALFFGVSGLLPQKKSDDYTEELKQAYGYLAKRFRLIQMQPEEWKFLRMRPMGFPTMRIAQLANWVKESAGLFSKLVENRDLNIEKEAFEMEASGYWNIHYRFGETSVYHSAGLGEDARNRVLINAVAPLILAYGIHVDRAWLKEKAFDLLNALPAEDNKIVRMWDRIGVEMHSAYDSQAYTGLYKMWCLGRKCLDCSIGISLLKGERKKEVNVD